MTAARTKPEELGERTRAMPSVTVNPTAAAPETAARLL